MIIKVSLFCLVLLLIAVIAGSYYVNSEGFDTISGSGTGSPAASCPTGCVVGSPSTVVAGSAGMTPSAIASSTIAPASGLGAVPGPAPYSSNSVPPMDPSTGLPQGMGQDMLSTQVGLTDTGYAAMSLQQRSNLLNSIQQVVKNELLANRATEPISSDNSSPSMTLSTAQGYEYDAANDDSSQNNCNSCGASCGSQNNCSSCGDSCDASDSGSHSGSHGASHSGSQGGSQRASQRASHKNHTHSKMPDMSQYIRKDSIPCAGCTLDY